MSDCIPIAERFAGKYEIDLGSGCWNWTAAISGHGYAKICKGGTGNGWVPAHRVAYELYVAPIPPELHIDHLCRNRKCVNPSHLETVTCAVNILRGVSPPADNLRKTHCLRGHLLADPNLYTYQGRRLCRICRQEHDRKRRPRRRNGSTAGMGPDIDKLDEECSLAIKGKRGGRS